MKAQEQMLPLRADIFLSVFHIVSTYSVPRNGEMAQDRDQHVSPWLFALKALEPDSVTQMPPESNAVTQRDGQEMRCGGSEAWKRAGGAWWGAEVWPPYSLDTPPLTSCATLGQ